MDKDALIADLIRLIEKARSEAFWNNCEGYKVIASTQEHMALQIEKTLTAHGCVVPPSRYRGYSTVGFGPAHFHFMPRPVMSVI